MFTKAKILNTDRISTSDFVEICEKYHASGKGIKLNEKLSEQAFRTYIKTNPNVLAINREIEQINLHNQSVEEKVKMF